MKLWEKVVQDNPDKMYTEKELKEDFCPNEFGLSDDCFVGMHTGPGMCKIHWDTEVEENPEKAAE